MRQQLFDEWASSLCKNVKIIVNVLKGLKRPSNKTVRPMKETRQV